MGDPDSRSTSKTAMAIRAYQPGDEDAQAAIDNAAAGALPGFKPSTATEFFKRYEKSEPDSRARYYAVEDDQVIGYTAFVANSRVQQPVVPARS